MDSSAASSDVFDRDVRVDAMLVRPDRSCPSASRLERAFDGAPDRLQVAVHIFQSARRPQVPSELRSDHDLVADGSRAPPTSSSFRERASPSAVSNSVTPRSTAADEHDHLLFVGRRAIRAAHPHAAEADRRSLEVSECSPFSISVSLTLTEVQPEGRRAFEEATRAHDLTDLVDAGIPVPLSEWRRRKSIGARFRWVQQ